MTRTFLLAACFASALASCVSGDMQQDQQYQQSQQGQQGQQTGSMGMDPMQMAQSKDKSGSSQGNQGNKGGVNVVINNPIILIATNAGGNAQTQQMNAPVQPPAATHTVTVGGSAGLVYSPDNVAAAKWDMVQFNFMAKNHTVTQSTFPAPCTKMQPMAPAAGMPAMPAPVDSGFMPFNGTGAMPMMMVQVTDTTTPMWFYCRQKKPTPHCGDGNGMTFSINPNMPGMGSKTQAAFKALAMMQGTNSTSTGSAAASGAAMMPGSAMQAPAASSAAPPQNQAAGSTSSMMQSGSSSSGQMQAGGSTSQMQAGGSTSSQNQNSASMMQGTGQTGTGGACECSCLCGANAFPNAMQGIGMMGGGLPGAVPATGAGMKF